jgi:hypothetical protein
MEGIMTRHHRLIAVVAASLSTTAYAMPAAVPQVYYDNLPHRWAVLTNSPGFCGTPIGAMAPICQWQVEG